MSYPSHLVLGALPQTKRMIITPLVRASAYVALSICQPLYQALHALSNTMR